MFYLLLATFFLIWAIIVIKKGQFTWHSILSIYVITNIVVDHGDEIFDYWFYKKCYDLPAHLLKNPAADSYLGLVFSDGVIFPLIAIIFCYYATIWRHPWLLSIIGAPFMALIEVALDKTGFMVCYHWSHWFTLVITFISFRILAHYAHRFIYYSPPVSYRFWLVGVIYVSSDWPGYLVSWGTGQFALYRPHLFVNPVSDDRFTDLMLTTILGICLAYFAPKVRKQFKPFLFLGLSVCWITFAFWMYSRGMLIYNHWSHIGTIARYLEPCILAYFIDRWETNYLSTLH
ncbi:MAG: hypothetical protein Q8936_22655 [Bacillota bacterium]|nr:hypothetical protein [Bacillota bacterium]